MAIRMHAALRRCTWLLALGWLTSLPATAALPEDPFRSPMWEYNLARYLGADAAVRHSDTVVIKTPPFAEDATQVPLTVDLSAFPHEIKEVITWVDLNPVPHLFTLRPEAAEIRTVALNFRIQQASTVRAAVRDEQGGWHVGSVHVEAAGGGCTAPSATASNPDWADSFGQVRGALFSPVGGVTGTRLKVQVMHPMDSGMVGNIPRFNIETLELRQTANQQRLASMALSESASENPLFVFDLEHDAQQSGILLLLRDNGGNLIESRMGI
ncbi:quinoprotein dehydrogenase-associated SoxYZ-like carrier [Billgrantia kenyensis]|uniref:Quinoprotein dehydrogenase-associated SoxYZ-like carrier n=1 Tax=Billgrantia kenyensis TaxID=321266 RepID=A0A7V9VZJ7_9GAMM|nr:quinoprotein dehydrogenase-associated SoxYZ-like carrier [Halomonas kenyensis]MBA2778319.1 quinoprotein dehydrogenase-associated SoxYZ-like carrier [Halomonas kenyensis]MCG6660626.1 quinoprotein dehydrogenase-associated SoxYZ-like carrier [Halomonas kenyensis]